MTMSESCEPRLTHRVAVTAYIFSGNRVLLLHRVNEPKIWGPPGGRLQLEEDPRLGVSREIFEETGLEIELLGVVDIWFGSHGGGKLVSIDYLARSSKTEVVLSEEHSDYRWASLEDLKNGNPPLAQREPAFLLKDFEKAFQLHDILGEKFRKT